MIQIKESEYMQIWEYVFDHPVFDHWAMSGQASFQIVKKLNQWLYIIQRGNK
jgi:hypothetical protein